MAENHAVILFNSKTPEWAWMSNFSSHPVVSVDGRIVAPTAEHAYQASRTLDGAWQARILAARTPAQAKQLGKEAPDRPGWAEMKTDRMLRILLAKFRQHTDLGVRLLATGSAELIHHTPWGDRFWGDGGVGGRGQNVMGNLLMQVRDVLRAEA